MSKQKPAQFVELDWRGDFPALYCPACGRGLFAPEGPCDHVLLISTDSESFDYVRADLRDVAKALAEEGERPCELARKVDPERAFFLSITTSGVGCCPFSIARLVGVEFPQR